jgi:hypothetical protein
MLLQTTRHERHAISAKYILFASDLATPHEETLRLVILPSVCCETVHSSWHKLLQISLVYFKRSWRSVVNVTKNQHFAVKTSQVSRTLYALTTFIINSGFLLELYE